MGSLLDQLKGGRTAKPHSRKAGFSKSRVKSKTKSYVKAKAKAKPKPRRP